MKYTLFPTALVVTFLCQSPAIAQLNFGEVLNQMKNAIDKAAQQDRNESPQQNPPQSAQEPQPKTSPQSANNALCEKFKIIMKF